MKIKSNEFSSNKNGWNEILPLREPNPTLKGVVEADWVVLGAGFTGLSAARRLAKNRPSEKVVLIDGLEIGEGSSGRSSGFAIDLPHNITLDDNEIAIAKSYKNICSFGINQLGEIVKNQSIECDWAEVGKFHAAVTPAVSSSILKPYAHCLEAMGESYEWYSSEQLKNSLGLDHYDSAIYTPGTILLNPAALARGLADSMPENVTIYENSQVTDFTNDEKVRLITNEGQVVCRRLILANNGLITQFGYLKNRILPLLLYASLTRPLTDAERRSLGRLDQWGVTPASHMSGITIRLTSDKRILIRQHIESRPSHLDKNVQENVRKNHKLLLDERFPGLSQVSIEHTWSGFISFSRNGAPGFGKFDKNIFASVCHNGVGIAKGTASGVFIADYASGERNPLLQDYQNLGVPCWNPPRPFLDIGSAVRIAYERFRGRDEV